MNYQILYWKNLYAGMTFLFFALWIKYEHFNVPIIEDSLGLIAFVITIRSFYILVFKLKI